MAPATRANIPAESSWRMVEEGENESFDTTFRETFDDEDRHSVSSGHSQITVSSSQGPPSQDSARDFTDDSQVILRIPFQPSLASRRHPSTDNDNTPVPRLTTSIARVDKAARPVVIEPNQVRRRAFRNENSNQRSSSQTSTVRGRREGRGPSGAVERPSLMERFTNSAPEVLFDCLAWVVSVIGMAFRMMRGIVALLLVIYVVVVIATMTRNRIARFASSALQPICRFPGVSHLDLPFCLDDPNVQSSKATGPPVEFSELMHVQSMIETVAEDSASKVSLPLEMKQTEASVRDLRTMVKYSELPVRDELVYEFDGYIEAVRRASRDLQSFNTQVESVIDSLISINRWTSRNLDSISENQNFLSQGFNWLLAPFQPGIYDESVILDKYIEHIALVSDEIERLILKAEATLTHLYRAENHVHSLQDYVVRGKIMVNAQRDEVFWDLWTLVGGNTRRLQSLKGQLSLLRQVDGQRNSATAQLTTALNSLDEMESKLSHLRDRVARPALLADASTIPMRVHIDTIDAALARLVAVNSRSRAEAAERWKRALNWPKNDDRLIER